MSNETDDLDEVRHQHHLRHRSKLDQQLSQLVWLVILVCFVARISQRTISWWGLRSHLKHRSPRILYVSTPKSFEKVVAFFIAVSLLPFPRLYGRIIVFSLPLGKIFCLTAFACIIGALIVSVDAPRFSNHFVEDIAFRAAWITLAQVPLVYLLATKRGPLNVLAGISYERVNWIHRWAGRIIFVSATIHMGIMMQTISVSDILNSSDKVMTIVRYGVGAYGALTWTAISSVLPIRRWSYRVFYVNHWISTSVFLGVLYLHIPKYARSAIYMSIMIVLLDTCLSCYSILRCNICIQTLMRKFSKFRKGPSRKAITIGHPVKMTAPVIGSNFTIAESTTIIRICDVPFTWKPGQHVRLYLPRLGGFEVHPFTPATCFQPSASSTPPSKNSDIENDPLLIGSDESPSTNEMVLMIRTHSGLTQRLAKYHSQWLSRPCPNASRPSSSLTAIIDGPYGTPPAWEEHENLILISTSTGVSFSLSIMDYLEQLCKSDPARLHTQHVRFIWTVHHLEPQFDTTVTELLVKHSTMLRETGIPVTAEFYVTCPKSEAFDSVPEMLQHDQFAHLRRYRRRQLSGKPPLRIWNPDRIVEMAMEEEEFDHADEGYLDYIEPEESDVVEKPSFESDASSTLIDEEEEKEVPARSFWSQFPSPRWECRRPSLAAVAKKENKACECALLQSRRDKWNSMASATMFIERFYGSQPDILDIVKAATENTKERVMVAVCSNRNVAAQARHVVARLNFDFVAGRREAIVEVFTEGFL